MPQTDTTTSVRTRTAVKTLVAVALTASALAAAAGIVSLADRPTKKPIPPFPTSALTVTQVSPPNGGTYVKGTKNVDMLGVSFSAAAATTVTSLKFDVVSDDDAEFAADTANDVIVQDHISSCSLYDRTSGASLAGPEPTDASGAVTFTGSLTVSGRLTAGLRCDFANVSTQNGNDDIYAYMISSATNITAQDATGSAVPASRIMIGSLKKPGVNTNKAVNQIVTDAGSLTFSLDGSTPASSIVLGGSTGVTAAVFKFDASVESFTVQDLTLYDSEACDVANSVKISYLDATGATKENTQYFSGCEAYFSGLSFWISESQTPTLTVTIDTNSVSAASTTSGNKIAVGLNAKDAAFQAVGANSGQSLTSLNTDVLGNAMVVRATKPTFTVASGTPTGSGIPGLSEVLRFNVSADSHGDVELEQVLFKIMTQDYGGTGWNNCGDGTNKVFGDHARWTLYDKDDLSTPISDEGDWSLLTSSGEACGQLTEPVGLAVLNLSADLATDIISVPAGSTKTYILKLDTTGASAADDDSIRVEIVNETGADATGHDAILWSDTYATDIDGSFVKNLPVTGGTIMY